jgi:DNA-binding SARP family transcriptional activator
MYFRVLGALEAGSDGAVAALGPPKQRALLAILLLHLGEIVPTDRLIDLLWGEGAPRTAAHSVQIYVSELRKALDPLGGQNLIATRQPGYQLEADADSVDARQFERLIEEGTRKIEAGARDEGAAALRSALALWRGPALSDFAYEEFAQPYIRRLHDLHLDAIEELVGADAPRLNPINRRLRRRLRRRRFGVRRLRADQPAAAMGTDFSIGTPTRLPYSVHEPS